MDATKQAIWCYIVECAFGKDFTGRIALEFKDGGLCNIDPNSREELKVPRKMLPSKNFNGHIQLDCNLFTGTIIESVVIK